MVANSVSFGIISKENVFIFQIMESQESSILWLHFGARGQQIVSAASDGLIKLWTLKSSEGAATMDQMKVWALVVKGDDSALDQPFRALNVLKELME